VTVREFNADTFGDLEEEVFVRHTIQESTLDIHLLDVMIMDGGQTEDQPKGAESPCLCEGSFVVNTLNLSEAAYAEARFVLEELAVCVKLLFEHPGGVEGLGVGGERCNYPNLMASDVVELNFHCHEPVFFVQLSKDVPVSLWIFEGGGFTNYEVGLTSDLVDLVSPDDQCLAPAQIFDDVGRVNGGQYFLWGFVVVGDICVAFGGRQRFNWRSYG
jgi:hypothetical protein